MSLLDLAPSNVTSSPEVMYIKGGFGFERTSVPFYAAALQAGMLDMLLRLPSQIPIDPENPLELNELFQRELDVKRVDRTIVPYLRAPERLRFFNALTVVLLPAVGGNDRRLAREYPQTDTAPTGRDGLTRIPIGPIALTHPEGNDRVGYLSWNLNETVPVVLDGQHRFRAMQTILKDTAGRLRDDLHRAEISVLFLILDPRAGFVAPAGTTALGACREIFIDINKHARVVPRTRLFLLDDRDVVSVSMRRVLEPSVKPQDTSVAVRVAAEGRLPLGLVDWRGSDAKFDKSPYVTSLLTFHDIVERVADVPRFDALDYERARKAIDRLTARFELGEEPDFPSEKLRDDVDAAEAGERPFELGPKEVTAAAKGFFELFGPRIVHPLVRLTPYAALIDALESAEILGTRLEPWLSFDTDERRALVDELNVDDPAVVVERAWTKVKSAYPLAFQVVFQKASLFALNSLLSWPEQVAALLWPDGLDDGATVLDSLIERFNDAVCPSLVITGIDSPFLGAGVRVDGTTDFRKTRINAITGFIVYLLLAPIDEWRELDDEDLVREAASEWVAERWGQIAPGPRDPIRGLFSVHGKNWRNSVDDVITVDDETSDDDEAWVEARLAHAAEQLVRAVLASQE
jgi:hypothetical protein